MILHSCVEQVMTMCRVKNESPRFNTFFSYLPFDPFYAYSCPLFKLNTLWNIIMIFQLCRTGFDDVLRTRMTTLAVILSELFPSMVSDCNFVHNLKTVWNI